MGPRGNAADIVESTIYHLETSTTSLLTQDVPTFIYERPESVFTERQGTWPNKILMVKDTNRKSNLTLNELLVVKCVSGSICL